MKNDLPRLSLSASLCYGMGSLAKSVQGLAISVYLLYFLTDVLGLAPGPAANIVFWGRVWDLLNDPLVGALVDRTGSCRAFLKYATVPGGVLLALCFAVPALPDGMAVLWVVAAYLLQALACTLTQIPVNTLMGRLSPRREERARLNQISLFISLAGNYLVTSYTLPFAAAAGGGDLRRGFFWVGILFGAVYILSYLLVWWGTRGLEQPSGSAGQPADTPAPALRPTALLRNHVRLCVVGLYLFFTIATVLESSAMVYYCQYVFGDTGLLQTYSSISTLCCLAVFALLSRVVRALGNSGTCALGCALYTAAHLVRFAAGDLRPVMLAGWAVANVGLSLVSGSIMLNVFDAAVYGEWKTGLRRDALLMSGFTLSSQVGMAIGSAAVGWALELTPYAEGLAVQPPEVNRLLLVLNTLVPAAAVGVSLLLAIPVMRSEHRLPRMLQELSERTAPGCSL